MANLTDSLQTPMSGVDMPTPHKAGPGIFEGLVSAATTFLGAEQGAEATTARRAASARQAKLDAEKAAKDATENDTAQAELDIYSGVPGAAEAATAAATAATPLAGLQTAANQGRATRQLVETRTEMALRDLFSKHPDNKAAVLDQFHKHGLMSPLMAGYDRAEKDVAADEAFARKQREDAISHAVNHLGLDPNTDPAVLEAKGRESLALEYTLEQNIKGAGLAGQIATNNRQQREDALRDASGAVSNSAMNFAMPQLEGVIKTFTNLAFDPSAPPDIKQQKLTAVGLAFDVQGRLRISNIMGRVRGSMKPEDADRLEANLNRQLGIIKDMMAGPLSEVQGQARAYTAMQNGLRINTMQALPFYSALKEAFGQGVFSGTTAEAFIQNNVIGGPNAEKLQRELTQYNPLDQGDGKRHLANAIAILKGETQLRSLTPEEGRAQIPGMVGTMTQLAGHSAAANGTDVNDHRTLVLAIGAAGDAAATATSQWGVANLHGLIDKFTKPGVNMAVFGMGQRSNQDAVGLVRQVVVPGMQNLHEALKEAPTNDAYWKVEFNGRTGKYQAVQSQTPRSQSGQSVARYGYLPGASEGWKPSDVTQRKVEGLNRSLDWLTNIGMHGGDPAIPKSVHLSYPDARRLYAQGIVPTAMRNEKNKPAQATATWEQNADRALGEALQGINADNYQPGEFTQGLTTHSDGSRSAPSVRGSAVTVPSPEAISAAHAGTPELAAVLSAADKHGVPHDVALRLVHVESRFNANAHNGGPADARGLTQVTRVWDEAAQRRYGKPRTELTAQENADLGMWILAKNHEQTHSWRSAVAMYHSGRSYERAGNANDGNMSTRHYANLIAGDDNGG